MGVATTAWAEDCILRGTASATSARSSDEVNSSGRLDLSDTLVEALDDGRTFRLDSVTLAVDDILALELSGPRGHPERRLGTVRHRLVAEIGPYIVAGDFHTLRGVMPLTAFRHRPAIVPLTAAVVELRDGSVRWEVDAVGVNQQRVSIIREADGEEPEPDLVAV